MHDLQKLNIPMKRIIWSFFSQIFLILGVRCSVRCLRGSVFILHRSQGLSCPQIILPHLPASFLLNSLQVWKVPDDLFLSVIFRFFLRFPSILRLCCHCFRFFLFFYISLIHVCIFWTEWQCSHFIVYIFSKDNYQE